MVNTIKQHFGRSVISPAKWLKQILILVTLFLVLSGCSSQKGEIKRTDHTLKNGELSLFVREIENTGIEKSPQVLLMLHGGGPSSVASFDLPVKNGSFAEFLVEKGIKTYLMDLRGWGGSTDPDFNSKTDSINVSYKEAAKDIDTVVNWILEREGRAQIAFFGWATGGHWGGYYCTQHGQKISHFISLNSLYPVEGDWGLNAAFGSPNDSTRFNPELRGWRISEQERLTRSWDRSIPVEDKQSWRDSSVAHSYREEAVSQDISFPDSVKKMKVPSGWREETFYMAQGKPYWYAADISSKSLIIRGGLDFWTRPIDLVAFKQDHPEADTLTIRDGTHYLFMDRLERGKQQLIDAIAGFLDVK